MSSGLNVRTYSDARLKLQENLTVLRDRHFTEFSDETIKRLVHYIFGTSEAGNTFWSLVVWIKTFEPHRSIWHQFFTNEGVQDSQTRKREVEAALKQIECGINYFCGAGPVLNDFLGLLDERYRARLKAANLLRSLVLPVGCNLITELRDAVKETENEILRAISRGRPGVQDYLLEYLLAVSGHVFRSARPTGDSSNTFCLLAQAVFSACFFFENAARPTVEVSQLDSRIRRCREAGGDLFEYSTTTDSFIATERMIAETLR